MKKIAFLGVGNMGGAVLRGLKSKPYELAYYSPNSMVDGVKKLSALEGIFCAPEGGSLYAATKKLIASKFISSRESVLLLNTGSGFKYLDGLSEQIKIN